MCTKPLIRAETFESYINKKGQKSYKVEWLQREQYDKGQIPRMKYRRINEIPCGKCIECRLNYSREWATRCMLELNYGYNGDKYPDGTAWFLTITYKDEYLKTHKTVNTETGETYEGISLCKEDIQKFWKRLRKKYPQMQLKYIECGEYGSRTLRPHYHAIVYGLPLPMETFKKIGMNNLNQPIWQCDELNNVWGMGFVTIGRVTWESSAYVARYTLKKSTGAKYDKNWYMMQGLIPEFITMSQGIAKSYFNTNLEKIYNTDTVPIVNKKSGANVKPPKSYDRMLKEIDPELYEKIKHERELSGKNQEMLLRQQTNLTPEERRIISETRMKEVLKDIRMEV